MNKVIQSEGCGAHVVASFFSRVYRALSIRSKKNVLNTIVALVGFTFSLSSFAQVNIDTMNQSKDELKIKRMLETLQEKYNLEPWIYTDKVIVDSGVGTPHSHPVLTMNTNDKYLNSEANLLATFLHEQFHWHLIENGNAPKGEFRKAIKAKFPGVQFERPFGSGAEGSTLSHIIVCYLEFKALASLIGEAEAAHTLQTRRHYTWVFGTVVDSKNHAKLEKLVDQFGLQIEVGGQEAAKPVSGDGVS